MSQGLAGFLPFVLVIAMFYLMIFLPEKKRKKNYSSMIQSLNVNDEIITKGGVIGRIVNLQDDFVILETGPDRIRIKFDKNGILNVISGDKTEEKKDK